MNILTDLVASKNSKTSNIAIYEKNNVPFKTCCTYEPFKDRIITELIIYFLNYFSERHLTIDRNYYGKN